MENPINGISQFVIIKKCEIMFKAKKAMGEIYCTHGKDEKFI
jgi:hypothetical protein